MSQSTLPISPLHRHLHVVREEDSPPYDGIPRVRVGSFAMMQSDVFDKLSGDGFALAIYAVLAKHANKDGVCWPSVATICKALGWSRKVVEPAIQRLCDAGLVTKERRQHRGMDQSNLYRLPAYVQVVPREPAVVPTAPMGSSHGTSGTFPQNDELDPIELDKELEDDPPTQPKKPLPENGVAQQIVAAYCTVAGIDAPAVYGKAVGQAARLAKAGVTPAEIPQLYGYVAKWAEGVDLGLMLGQVDKWRASRNVALNGAAPPMDYSSPEYLADVRRRANARLV